MFLMSHMQPLSRSGLTYWRVAAVIRLSSVVRAGTSQKSIGSVLRVGQNNTLERDLCTNVLFGQKKRSVELQPGYLQTKSPRTKQKACILLPEKCQ